MEKDVVLFLKKNPNVIKYLKEWLTMNDEDREDKCPHTMETHRDSPACEFFCMRVFPKIGSFPGLKLGLPLTWRGCPCHCSHYTKEDVIQTVQKYMALV